MHLFGENESGTKSKSTAEYRRIRVQVLISLIKNLVMIFTKLTVIT